MKIRTIAQLLVVGSLTFGASGIAGASGYMPASFALADVWSGNPANLTLSGYDSTSNTGSAAVWATWPLVISGAGNLNVNMTTSINLSSVGTMECQIITCNAGHTSCNAYGYAINSSGLGGPQTQALPAGTTPSGGYAIVNCQIPTNANVSNFSY